jgi:hypothetical protein
MRMTYSGENPMRYLGWLFAGAVTFLATQVGTTTKSAEPTVDPMASMEIQMRANKNMPLGVMADPF